MTESEFIRVWNKHDNIQDVADELGYTNLSVRSIATRIRKRGYDVPKKYGKKKGKSHGRNTSRR